tara:strand:+ start:1437 stop:2591 length:1155 start_codon:yes stop_codon:yes gene_type:complete
MKKVTLILGITIIVASCGSKSSENKNVAQLHKTKDSLKTIYDNIAVQIAEIDDQLKALDTTITLPIVTTQEVEVKAFSHFLEVQGAVETGGNATLYPETNGTIINIVAKEGQKINKGDVILRIDAGMLQSSLKEIETSYDLAKQIFEKQERLWKNKIGSEVDYLQAKTNKQTLEQKQNTIKEQLDMYVVRSPITGVVDEIMPNVGEAANPVMPVARVINYDETYIKADVSEDYITTVKKGTLVKVFFPSLNKEYEAKVDRTGSYINPANRTFKVHISLNNIDVDLQPNLLADIRLRDFYQDTAIVIPSSIIQQDRKGHEYVYLTHQEGNNTAVKKVILKTGVSYKNETIVIEGLKGQELFIDKGARRVQAGDIVEIVASQTSEN